jgi:hypothetical protein
MNNNNISLLAISFRQGFIPPKLPIVTFKQGDKDITFLIDSGSNRNVINKEALAFIEHEVIESKDKITLSGLNASPTEVSLCSIKFSNDGKEYKQTFLVTDLSAPMKGIKEDHGLTVYGMLGSPFLEEYKVILDYDQMIAYSKQ